MHAIRPLRAFTLSRSGARYRDHQTGSLRRLAWLSPTNRKIRAGADPRCDPGVPPPLNTAFSNPRSRANSLKNAANSTKSVIESMRAKENLFVNGSMSDTRQMRSKAGTRCFSCGFSRSCERIRGPSRRFSPKGTPLEASRPSLPGSLSGELRMLMNRFGRDPHDNRNVYFDNYKAQRSLQDTLRNYPLTFWVLEERRCIRDGSHVFGLRREIPWSNSSLTRKLRLLIA